MQLRNGRSTGPPPTLTDAITSAAPAAAAPPAAAPAPAPAAPAAPAAPLAAATPSAAAAPPAAPQAPHYDDEVSVAQSRGHRSPTPDGFDVQLAEALDGYDTADEEATSPAAGARSVSAPADEPVDPAATEESAWDWIGEMLAQHEAGDIDLSHLVTRTMPNVPKGARELFGDCLALIAEVMLDADDEQRLRADALTIMLPRLLLFPFSSDWFSSRTKREVRRRCRKFLAYKWKELFRDGAGYAAGLTDAGDAAQREEVLRARREEADAATERTALERRFDHVVKLVQEGLVSKAANHLTSLGVAPTSDDTADKLRDLQFPTRAPLRDDQRAALAHRAPPHLLTPEQAEEGIAKAPRRSAGGPSGWKFEYAKGACEHEKGRHAMATILSRVGCGQFGLRQSNGANTHLVSGSRLIALDRGDGRIRPVAVGECLRRLAASCLVRAHRPDIEHRCLRANNLAFSNDGCNVGIKTVQTLLQANPEWLCVETDLANAFQRASREDMLAELYADDGLRDLVPLFLSLYSGSSNLFYAEVAMLLSREGSQQGCPLGTLLFVLSTAAAVEDVIAAFPNVTVVAFADDVRFLGPAVDALDAAALYREKVEELGHEFQAAKGFVFSHTQATLDAAADHPLSALMQVRRAPEDGSWMRTPEEGLKILGAPYGADDWCEAFLDGVGSTITEHLDAIEMLAAHDKHGSAQAAFLLLRFSASTKVQHLLRYVPPSLVADAATAHDRAVSSCLSHLLDARTDPLGQVRAAGAMSAGQRALRRERRRACEQAQLPVAAGGLGLGCARATCDVAWVASWVDFLRFVGEHDTVFPALAAHVSPQALRYGTLRGTLELHEAYARLGDNLARTAEDGSAISGTVEMGLILGEQVRGVDSLHLARPRPQGALGHAVSVSLEREWRADASRAEEVRLTSCGGKEAAWVTAIPSRPEYRLASPAWRDSIALRLGVPLEFLVSGPTNCCCVDVFDRRTGAIAAGVPGARRASAGGGQRTRVRPQPVDTRASHDHRCAHSFKLGRHDRVQDMAQRKLGEAAKPARLASVYELRAGSTDRSQDKADLVVSHLTEDGTPTLLDVGITYPLIDTYLKNSKSTEKRAFAADTYAQKKKNRYAKIIAEKGLDFHYRSFCLDTLGAFGEDTWAIINAACGRDHPKAIGDYCPWRNPDPKRDFVISIGMALQRANSSMLRASDARRRNARMSGKYASSSRVAGPDAVPSRRG